MTDLRIVSISEFMRRTSLSKATVYRMIDRHELPRPSRISPNRVGFASDIVDAWIASKSGAA
jgi:prophage regulatory protein